MAGPSRSIRRLHGFCTRHDAAVADDQQSPRLAVGDTLRLIRKDVAVLSQLVADCLSCGIRIVDGKHAAASSIGEIVDDLSRLGNVTTNCSARAVCRLDAVNSDVE